MNEHDNGRRMFCQLNVSTSGSMRWHVESASFFVTTLCISIVHLTPPASVNVVMSTTPQTPSGPSVLIQRVAVSRRKVRAYRFVVMKHVSGATADIVRKTC